MKLQFGCVFILFCFIGEAYLLPDIPDVDIFGSALAGVDNMCKSILLTLKVLRFLKVVYISGHWLLVQIGVRVAPPHPYSPDIAFELRTRCNKKQYSVDKAELMLQSPDFDINRKTVVFVSGWNTDLDLDYITELTQAYLCRDEHNFIVS